MAKPRAVADTLWPPFAAGVIGHVTSIGIHCPGVLVTVTVTVTVGRGYARIRWCFSIQHDPEIARRAAVTQAVAAMAANDTPSTT